MKWAVVRVLKVRREFTPGPEPDSMRVRRDCGLGCTCAGEIYKVRSPLHVLAESKTLCFNDRKKQGISEQPGTARAVDAAEPAQAFEVTAHLVQAVRE